MRYLAVISLFFICISSLGQTLKERLIVTDTEDSLLLKAESESFDRDGNYCFVIRQNGKEYFQTRSGKTGGFDNINSVFGGGGDIDYTYPILGDKGKPWYYKNFRGIQPYGPAVGKLERPITTETRENIALTTSYKDSVLYYLNGRLISKNHVDQTEKSFISINDWCAFSDNGNKIYVLKRDQFYELWVNDRLLTHTEGKYYQLAINDAGQYIYAEGQRPDTANSGYDYMFFIHTTDTLIGPVRTVWNFELKENGSYYYSGDDNGTSYIIINNKIKRNIQRVSDITIVDHQSYLFTFEEDGADKINVNGQIYSHEFSEIFYPSIDRRGNFAFYGLKNYYLYKYVNGKQIEEPVTKYGVRPVPLYISPEGQSLHYFRTQDSIYLYRDDSLLFRPLAKNKVFTLAPYTDVIPYTYIRGKSKIIYSLFYLQYDTAGYFIYNGTFSKPMIPLKKKSYSKIKDIGEILAGEFGDQGFFAIQKTGETKYLVNINNTTYKEVDNVSDVFYDDCYFNGSSLIFYGVRDRSFYQFKVEP